MKNRNSTVLTAIVLENVQTVSRKTEILLKSNTNTKKLDSILSLLTQNELVKEFEGNFLITDSGRKYLEAYRKFSTISESFGLKL